MATRDIVLRGHLLDSLLLSKILDEICAAGARVEVRQMVVGIAAQDESTVALHIDAQSSAVLAQVMARLADHGFTADAVDALAVHLLPAPADGVFPDRFYSTTNLPTEVYHEGRWWPVDQIEMDCGVCIRADGMGFFCCPVSKVRAGDAVVVGVAGVAVQSVKRAEAGEPFAFMSSEGSTEQPKAARIRAVAQMMRACHAQRREILWVVGPAVVHTGGGDALERLVDEGWVDCLYTGNALAVHDVEQALYHTALGRDTATDRPVDGGHCHHLRAINRIRAVGSIAAACDSGLLTRGVMHACHTRNVRTVIAGSIRDDGPLPETITDILAAQDAMRVGLGRVGVCVMVATTLHAIAVGNLLPATVPVVLVDINPAVVTKLADRGTGQGQGLVTDAAFFVSALAQELCGDGG
jgi:lysine-ketoglutarate reductase/saccharopine dehydrogenase-like protein (TIGR00300 family)